MPCTLKSVLLPCCQILPRVKFVPFIPIQHLDNYQNASINLFHRHVLSMHKKNVLRSLQMLNVRIASSAQSIISAKQTIRLRAM